MGKIYYTIILLSLIICIYLYITSNNFKPERLTIYNKEKKTKIPIFIIVHDKLECLKKSIYSYRKYIDPNITPFEIVYYDSMSTYKPTIQFLKDQERDGSKVYWSNINNHKLVLNAVNSYLKLNPTCKYFVITDPDIELYNTNRDILEFYKFLLEKYQVMSVGPMLKIDDIPNYYSKKQKVLQLHRKNFWDKVPNRIQYKINTYNIQFSAIDTTFQLFSRKRIPINFPNKNCIRCYNPYMAKHLDWYIDPYNMTNDQKYYDKKSTKVSHWGRDIIRKNNQI